MVQRSKYRKLAIIMRFLNKGDPKMSTKSLKSTCRENVQLYYKQSPFFTKNLPRILISL